MSKTEWKIFILMTLLLSTLYYVPFLWDGIWTSNTSNASNIHVTGLSIVILNACVWMLFIYIAITTKIENRRRVK